MQNSGFVLLDKPSGINSRAAGWRVARMFGAKTFGHVGTLDPMASGLLVIALGEATKAIPYLKNDEIKEYEFEIEWGMKTDTDDITGKLIEKSDDNRPDIRTLAKVLPELIGEIWQIPPAYSAIHVNGRRAYELARSGKKVEIPKRQVTIYDLQILNYELSTFIVRCSTGTYVRSVAQDIAKLCEKIATCSMIRRTKTNGFDVKNAVTLDFLENLFNNGGRAAISNYLQPVDFGLGDIPVWNLDNNDAKLFQSGGFISVRDAKSETRNAILHRVYRKDEFIGIGIMESGILKPKRIITDA